MAVLDPGNRCNRALSREFQGSSSLFGASSSVLVQSSQQDCNMNTHTTETEIDVAALLAEVEAYEAAEAAELDALLATVEYL